MPVGETDLRAKKRDLEQTLVQAIAAFERETSLSVTEITLTPGGSGNQGSHLKMKVELRS
jgi:hypothetical protein